MEQVLVIFDIKKSQQIDNYNSLYLEQDLVCSQRYNIDELHCSYIYCRAQFPVTTNDGISARLILVHEFD